MDDGEGLDCYDVELDRLENELMESAEDGVLDGLDELGEGEVLDLKPIVKERRNSYTLAEKMRYVDLCNAAWRANPHGPCVWTAVSGVPPRIFEHPTLLLCAIGAQSVQLVCLLGCATLM
jgi:hypothetical protein